MVANISWIPNSVASGLETFCLLVVTVSAMLPLAFQK